MAIKKERALEIMKKFTGCEIYPASFTEAQDCFLAITNRADYKRLVCVTEKKSALFNALQAEREQTQAGIQCKVAPLSGANAEIVRRTIAWAAPSACGRQALSLGLGDRLGLITPGHLQAVAGKNIKPVLAQQSVRECTLTKRNFRGVLDAATWGVLQAGYRDGYGADGDHLKTEEEIAGVLMLGYSMITLDCSEKIDNSIAELPAEQVAAKYQALPEDFREKVEKYYLEQEFTVGEFTISYTLEQLQRIVLTYAEAIVFASYIYRTYLKRTPWPIDFELSIDETITVTSPQDHFLVANELERQEVKLTSVAPRFCGEFQKGVDYIGDLTQFEAEFKVHAAIADKLGYRLSIHSGSDKLSVYPIIAKYTQGRVHVKTAGTNWLEGLRLICRVDKKLFREVVDFARAHFQEARAYYHVSTDLNKVPQTADLADAELETLLNINDGRQMLHITYGLILSDATLQEKLYAIWAANEQLHYELVAAHIGEHIQKLGR